jgi:hypothetical protein
MPTWIEVLPGSTAFDLGLEDFCLQSQRFTVAMLVYMWL